MLLLVESIISCLDEIKAVEKSRKRGASQQAAFTLLEVMVVLVVVFSLIAIALPQLAKLKAKSSRITCANQLKNIGLAFRAFSTDNADRFPMAFGTNQGGSSNYVQSPEMFRHFKCVSNELSSTLILRCIENGVRRSEEVTWDKLSNANIDYLVGVDAQLESPNRWLAGDRFLETDAPVSNYLVHLQPRAKFHWLAKPHHYEGKVVFSDGRVERISNSQWAQSLKKSDLETTRLAMPVAPARK